MPSSKTKLNSSSSTMDALLASLEGKSLTLNRGQQIEGIVTAISASDVTLDLDTKAEGNIPIKDFSDEQRANLKVGDRLTGYVVVPENDSGQVILSLYKQLNITSGHSKNDRNQDFQKFYQAMNSKAKLTGRVIEVNKGGLMVDVNKTRGFLPGSQINFGGLADSGVLQQGIEGLIGMEIPITVLEVDPNQNRLIFSSRTTLSAKALNDLNQYQNGQKVEGIVVAITPFGVFVKVASLTEDGMTFEGVIFPQETSWEKVEDISKSFTVGQDVEAIVVSIDQTLSRLVLSTRRLKDDPFEKLAENFQPDDVVGGTIREIGPHGLTVDLKEGVEGILPISKFETEVAYRPGQETNFLVDSIDKERRRVNLAPFLTSTSGLIYK